MLCTVLRIGTPDAKVGQGTHLGWKKQATVLQRHNASACISEKQLICPSGARPGFLSQLVCHCHEAAVHDIQLSVMIYPVELAFVAKQAQLLVVLQTLNGDVGAWVN